MLQCETGRQIEDNEEGKNWVLLGPAKPRNRSAKLSKWDLESMAQRQREIEIAAQCQRPWHYVTEEDPVSEESDVISEESEIITIESPQKQVEKSVNDSRMDPVEPEIIIERVLPKKPEEPVQNIQYQEIQRIIPQEPEIISDEVHSFQQNQPVAAASPMPYLHNLEINNFEMEYPQDHLIYNIEQEPTVYQAPTLPRPAENQMESIEDALKQFDQHLNWVKAQDIAGKTPSPPPPPSQQIPSTSNGSSRQVSPGNWQLESQKSHLVSSPKQCHEGPVQNIPQPTYQQNQHPNVVQSRPKKKPRRQQISPYNNIYTITSEELERLKEENDLALAKLRKNPSNVRRVPQIPSNRAPRVQQVKRVQIAPPQQPRSLKWNEPNPADVVPVKPISRLAAMLISNKPVAQLPPQKIEEQQPELPMQPLPPSKILCFGPPKECSEELSFLGKLLEKPPAHLRILKELSPEKPPVEDQIIPESVQQDHQLIQRRTPPILEILQNHTIPQKNPGIVSENPVTYETQQLMPDRQQENLTHQAVMNVQAAHLEPSALSQMSVGAFLQSQPIRKARAQPSKKSTKKQPASLPQPSIISMNPTQPNLQAQLQKPITQESPNIKKRRYTRKPTTDLQNPKHQHAWNSLPHQSPRVFQNTQFSTQNRAYTVTSNVPQVVTMIPSRKRKLQISEEPEQLLDNQFLLDEPYSMPINSGPSLAELNRVDDDEELLEILATEFRGPESVSTSATSDDGSQSSLGNYGDNMFGGMDDFDVTSLFETTTVLF